MNQNQAVTLDELIADLQEQRKVLGGDYTPRIAVDEQYYLIGEVVTYEEDCGHPMDVVYLHANLNRAEEEQS
jgi:hypothetical protein